MTRTVPLWAAIAAADRCSLDGRSTFAARVAARPTRPTELALVTCHRVELYGVADAGPDPDPDSDSAATPASAGAPHTADRPAPPLLLSGEDAVRHVLRLATGLESAVLGEDQVLHQVRLALADLYARRADPRLIRLFEVAVAAGRRVRSDRPAADRNLGELAARWLERRGGPMRGRTVVIVGAGAMGRVAASAVGRRGAHAIVASRSAGRAHSLAGRVHGTPTDLAGAVEAARTASGVIVALGGPWTELARGGVSGTPIVDLSFPAAVGTDARAGLGEAFADVDRLFAEAGSLAGDGATARDFRSHAEDVVEEAVVEFTSWSAGRTSVGTLRALRERSEQHRMAELERLLRRLPDLDPHERDLVEAFSQRLVAGLLHEPSAALRNDADGTAARAAERLFSL